MLTDIQTFCFYCRKVTKTESILNEMTRDDELIYVLWQAFKCSICHKSTIFRSDGRVDLLQNENTASVKKEKVATKPN